MFLHYWASRMKLYTRQRGFTLIELLTVIAILGILAALGLQAFSLYRANAAYASVQRTTSDGRIDADATLAMPDNSIASVSLFNQRVPGPLTDSTARALLPVLQVPRNISFSVSYDSSCTAPGCMSAFVEARHLYGKNYLQWVRTGDGYWTSVEMSGSGW